MVRVTPMSAQDALWLTMDRPNNLMVVDGAMVLRQAPDLSAVRGVFQEAVDRFPVLGRRAVRRGVGWGWQDDPTFDLDRHVTEAELPGPADLAALQRFVAEQRAIPLDRERPLWRGFLVHPLRLDDGSEGAAIVSRFHHAIADGVRLTQVMLSMLSDGQPTDGSGPAVDRGETAELTPPVPAGGLLQSARSTLTDVTGTLTGVATDVVSAARGVSSTAAAIAQAVAKEALDSATTAITTALADPRAALASAPGTAASFPGRAVAAAKGMVRAGAQGLDEGFEVVRRQDRFLDALEVLGVRDNRAANDLSAVAKLALADSTPTVWSGKPGRVKSTAWSRPLPLDGIKAVGRAHGATVNDVMLAAVAGGLRRYLAVHGGEADEVLWMVPVNLKPFEDNLPADLGNYFALVWLPMPLQLSDPVARLREMHRRMDRIKHSDEAVLTFGLQRLMSSSPRQITMFVTNFFANKAVGVLTNVPGPRGPMTFAGAPVAQVVGFAPCSGDNPMSATIFSYDGAVTVGFSTDAGLVPDPGLLADLVVEELTTMQSTLRTPAAAPPRRRRTRPTPP